MEIALTGSTLSENTGRLHITVCGILSVDTIRSLGQNSTFGGSVSVKKKFNPSKTSTTTTKFVPVSKILVSYFNLLVKISLDSLNKTSH